MKYMGNKTKLLPELAEIVAFYSQEAQRIADPFCGSAAVSWFLAMYTDKPIVAGDLQAFAVERARSVLLRTDPLEADDFVTTWFASAEALVDEIAGHFPNHLRSIAPELDHVPSIKTMVAQSRAFCSDVLPVAFRSHQGAWTVSTAYGGHYYSPAQALILDALRQTLPEGDAARSVCMAALVEAASKVAASPGHTAQPFQPTSSAAKYIVEAWSRDVWSYVRSAAIEIAAHSATVLGSAEVAGFEQTLEKLSPGDLVFADPPYSGVHYSRFYHVLEMITRGEPFVPSGSGRYPGRAHRPASSFSMKSGSRGAAQRLLHLCASKRQTLVLTFPTAQASNGLDAKDFIDLGKHHFSKVERHEFQSHFSTLGGNKKNRAARQQAGESVIVFIP